MRVLIITGGIGSGKSLVSKMLTETFSIPVYDADSRVKDLYSEIPSILDDIEDALGISLRNQKGEFVPRKLADIIFTDSHALHVVEGVVFPQLKKDFLSWSEAQNKEVVAFESATVLEKAEFNGFGDIVLVVDAPMSMRLSRACTRNGVDKDVIQVRMSAQPLMNLISEGGRCDGVDYVLMNDSTVEILHEKLSEFVDKFGLTKML